MRILWSCGLPTKWNGFFTEPDECSGEGELDVPDVEFHAGSVGVECDECGRYLEDSFHYDPEPPDGSTFTRYNQLHLNAEESP